MDELLHHCLRELSFDGDLGCNVSRLRDFVVDFYARSTTTNAQNTDDSFCAFIWSLVVQQPTVVVGTIPEGVTSEVWIAPQNSAKRKAKAKGEETVQVDPPRLDLVPDAKDRTLEDLVAQYGDQLRLATDPEATYAAITGTHIRFPKLSPMVYSALQIVTRGRDAGVTVVELGQKSKYDQKTCFYLVRQLTELELVVKVRRGGVGSHFVIHKYFFDRSESWKAIREEENRAAAEAQAPVQSTPADNQDEESANTTDLKALNFTPIDARHFNMLIAIGFTRPTKTDRRFFASRTRELVEQGVIENVFVPSKRRAAAGGVKCFRLVSSDPEQAAMSAKEGVVVEAPLADDDPAADEQSSVKMNITLHKQIISLIEESGVKGMTLNELAAALCNFDKRTVELLLSRAEKYPPPAHLSDLGIAGLMETSGRERRNRYFTIASYRALVAQENLDKSSAGYGDADLTNTGGFYPYGPESFWPDEAALIQYEDRDARALRVPGKTSKKPRKNPILPDGSVKKGRPRKIKVDSEAESDAESKPKKRKRKQGDDEGAEKKKAARPAKKRRLAKGRVGVFLFEASTSAAPAVANAEEASAPAVGDEPTPAGSGADPVPASQPGSGEDAPAEPPKKKRGRLPKAVDPDAAPAVPKKRARAKKVESEPAATPAKRVLRSKSQRKAEASEAAETVESDSQDPSPPAKRLRLESPSLSTPLTPLTVSEDIPAITTLSSALTSSISTPVLESTSLPDDSQPMDIEEPIAQPVEDVQIPTTELLTLDPSIPLEEPVQPDAQASAAPPTEDLVAAPETSVAVVAIKQKVNVSTLRRENELFRVIETMGGIVNTQTKELFDVHMELLSDLAKAREPASAPPGTRLDRRTAVNAYNAMELRGRVKQMKTTVTSPSGLVRPATLVYLPELEESKLKAFLLELSRTMTQFPPTIANAIVVDEHTEYGSKGGRGTRPRPTKQLSQQLLPPAPALPSNPEKPNVPPEQLFSLDEDEIRRILVSERTTIAQLYGFICGKMIRAREFHLHVLNAIETGHPSPSIVSLEKRIATFSFFYNELPLGLYCAVVAPLEENDELAQYLSDEQGRNTPVRELPTSLHTHLQIGRTRGRGRMLELLEIMRALGLAVPLEPCTSGEPFITCSANQDHPTSFKEVPETNTISEATSGPPYWHFTPNAAVYHWAASEANPAFLKDMPLTSCADAVQYWDLLRSACTDRQLSGQIVWDAPARQISAPKKVKTIRRAVSWHDGYTLTSHQIYYLDHFLQTEPGQTPLHLDEEAAEQIQTLCRVTCAPEQAVRGHLARSHAAKLAELDKSRLKMERELRNKEMDERAKASLARKAADARANRETKWDDLVRSVHPDPLGDAAAIRLRRVKALYLQATGSQTGRWEREIRQAVIEADMATTVPKWKQKQAIPQHIITGPGLITPLPAPAVVVNPPEKPISSLIAMQGPAVVEKVRPKKRQRQQQAEATAAAETPAAPAGPQTRNRFHWNKDFDELVKDAFAIILSRCRSRGKLDLGAIKQVFPGVPRNSVRNRMKTIKEVPAMAAYMSRLEDHWHEVWMKYRGSALLPDEDPLSLQFDLIAHIEFLRKHIDKNALRVGLGHVQQSSTVVLPESMEELLSQFDVVEPPSGNPPWDFMWTSLVDETREKRARRQAYTTRPDDLVLGTEGTPETVALAESALKMAMSIPLESYDPEVAAHFLHSVGAENVNMAQKNLLSRGVLAKRFKNPGFHPGRQLKISDINQNALGGSIPCDVFQDAIALEDISSEDPEWREWPLLATDGDTAALIQLVSDNKVDFKVDTTQAQLARSIVDWNSKKADDDHIETAIFVRFHDITITETPKAPPAPLLPPMDIETEAAHGMTAEGSPACCKRVNEDSMIDCPACLEEEWGALYASIEHEERDRFRLILDTVYASGAKGITKHDLLVRVLALQ
ncbi:hypothetical protein FB45DRAFT_915784 [Roridomyces roridus]|uniref:Transcription factor tau subunit sfc3/Tfc3 C-terminal domain-containing protein n=1 Tax=Roridomyces roridus TaxID=1738132 RepID=A0AAD7BTM4_9AGAR|nr:hypothetical protein FB45DRAFT_915784 [Roridomyces roridus]